MIKLFYDSENIIEAFEGTIETPERLMNTPFIEVSNDIWHACQEMHNKIINGELVSTPDFNRELKIYTDAVQNHLNSTANSRGYDNCYTCLSYLNSTNEIWRTESNIYNAWRDTCWFKCHEVLAQWQSGQIIQPTIEEVINQLPLITW